MTEEKAYGITVTWEASWDVIEITFLLRKVFSRMVMRAHHDKESEEEDEDSGHDQLDVSAGDLNDKNKYCY